jgi:hypothetical protein
VARGISEAEGARSNEVDYLHRVRLGLGPGEQSGVAGVQGRHHPMLPVEYNCTLLLVAAREVQTIYAQISLRECKA